MKIQLDPKLQMWIMAIVALVYIGANGSVALPLGVPEWVGPYIHSWSQFFISIYLVLAPIVLPGFSSSLPGPFAPPDPPAVKAATDAATKAAKTVAIVALVLVGLGGLTLPSGPARAAEGIKMAAKAEAQPLSVAPLNLPFDPLGLNKSKPAIDGTKPAGADDSIFSRIATLFGQDFEHAAADAIAEPSVQDGNGYVCWKAWQPLGNIIKRHPLVISGQIADDVEGARLVIAAFGQVCHVNECQIVGNDAASVAAKIVTALPISLNLPAPINLFAKTCNDIPNISLVAPPAGAAAPATTGN